MARQLQDLSTGDLKEVLFVTRQVLECKTVDELLSEALRLMERIFRAGSNNFYFMLPDGISTNLDRPITRGLEECFKAEFKEYYHKLDPLFGLWLSQLCPTSVTISKAISPKQWINSEYYNDFMRPQSIHHQMSIYLKNDQVLLGVLSLFRNKSMGDFSIVDQYKANLIAPYLAGALEKTLISKRMTEHDAIIDSFAHNLPHRGIVVLDESFEPTYQNEKARALLSAFGRTKTEAVSMPESLSKEIYLHCKDLLRSARIDGASKIPRRQFEMFSPIDKKKLCISIGLISDLKKNLLLLLLFFDPEDQENDESMRLKQQGLSKREREIAFLLSRGLRNKEISDKMFISEYTVENHLRSIYRKMNVTNRTGVVHCLLEMSQNRSNV
ncbi:MAG: helix-turn-helix transcriptional regulator [Syntrophorhabdales bacterium]|jgi:DNA-binding CsgD family transcriptional regulator